MASLETASGWVTAITRTWGEGDPARCRLCPRCHAVKGVCLIVANSKVPKLEAALFSTIGSFRANGTGRTPR